jgi:hypothetical protein
MPLNRKASGVVFSARPMGVEMFFRLKGVTGVYATGLNCSA